MAESSQYNAAFLTDLTQRIFGDTPFEIKHGDGVGRYVVGKQARVAGEIVLESQPYILIVNEAYIPNVCHSCFATSLIYDASSTEVQPCSCTCDMAFYCSEQCKASHWKQVHSLECQYMEKARNVKMDNVAKSKLRTLIRLLATRLREKEGLIIGPVFNDVASLISHTEKGDENTVIVQHARDILPANWFDTFDDQYLTELLSKADCNQFGLWSPVDNLLGTSLHPASSFFNHSCLPNTYCEWAGPHLVFKNLYAIPDNTEITISYIAANATVSDRQKELKRMYMFDCGCIRCNDAKQHKALQAQQADQVASQCKSDAFFYKYLQCPSCTGLMRLDAVGTQHLHASQDPNALSVEARSCMTCGQRRERTEKVPSLAEWSTVYDSMSKEDIQSIETYIDKVLFDDSTSS